MFFLKFYRGRTFLCVCRILPLPYILVTSPMKHCDRKVVMKLFVFVITCCGLNLSEKTKVHINNNNLTYEVKNQENITLFTVCSAAEFNTKHWIRFYIFFLNFKLIFYLFFSAVTEL